MFTNVKLNSDEYRLKSPIVVEIFEEGNEIIAYVKEIELYSFGSDVQGVMETLQEDLIDYYKDFVFMDDSRLGKFPRRWKKFLKEHIEEVEK